MAEPSFCPNCRDRNVRLLDQLSAMATVNYHRCDHCHHVWTTDKDTGEIRLHVTPLKAIGQRYIG